MRKLLDFLTWSVAERRAGGHLLYLIPGFNEGPVHLAGERMPDEQDSRVSKTSPVRLIGRVFVKRSSLPSREMPRRNLLSSMLEKTARPSLQSVHSSRDELSIKADATKVAAQCDEGFF